MPPNDSDLTEPSIETLRAENRSLRDRLEMSSRLNTRVASSLSPDEVLREIIDAARELTVPGCDRSLSVSVMAP